MERRNGWTGFFVPCHKILFLINYFLLYYILFYYILFYNQHLTKNASEDINPLKQPVELVLERKRLNERSPFVSLSERMLLTLQLESAMQLKLVQKTKAFERHFNSTNYCDPSGWRDQPMSKALLLVFDLSAVMHFAPRDVVYICLYISWGAHTACLMMRLFVRRFCILLKRLLFLDLLMLQSWNCHR